MEEEKKKRRAKKRKNDHDVWKETSTFGKRGKRDTRVKKRRGGIGARACGHPRCCCSSCCLSVATLIATATLRSAASIATAIAASDASPLLLRLPLHRWVPR